MLRVVALGVWLVLALFSVGATFAQESAPAEGDTVQAPDALDSVAARLAPLLVGAALIERTIEFLFNWVERAVLDAGSALHGAATRTTGLVHIGLREAWRQMNELATLVLKREGMPHDAETELEEQAGAGDWPLAALETRLTELQGQVEVAERRVQDAMKSEVYIARKKVTAAVLSVVLGVGLALVTNLRLFQPLGIDPWDRGASAFSALDLVLAGVLMGLGTDWVHQLISILTKGQRALGRVGTGGELDVEEVERVAASTVETEFETRLREIREQALREIEERIRDLTGGQDDSPA